MPRSGLKHVSMRSIFKCVDATPIGGPTLISRLRLVIGALLLAAFGLLCSACARHAISPAWRDGALSELPSKHISKLRFVHEETVVSNGVCLLTGSKDIRRQSVDVYRHSDAAMQLEIRVARVNTRSDMQADFGESRREMGRRLYCAGTHGGYSYAFTRFERQRNDPEGGGLWSNQWLMHLALGRDLTTVWCDVAVDTAQTLDMDDLIHAINGLVKQW